MSRDIKALARQLDTSHERWGMEQIKALIHEAQDGPGITRSEEATLGKLLEKHIDKMEPEAAASFRGFLDSGIQPYRWSRGQSWVKLDKWEPSQRGISMDPTGATGPVFLSVTGAVVTVDTQSAPPTNADRADGLYRLARLVDDMPGNIFAPPRTEGERRLVGNLFGEAKIDVALKGKVLDQLAESLAMVQPGAEPPEGLDAQQALQMRSSAVTVLLHLMESMPDDGAVGEIKARALELYLDLLGSTENPILRESMIFNLYAVRDSFSVEAQAKIDKVYPEIAPISPPYDSWFKDGNDTIRVSWRSGYGDDSREQFLDRDVESMVENHGFTLVTNERDHRVLEKEFNVNGVITKVVIDARVNNNSMFDNMDDPNTHIVGYSGHSDIGRNIRRGVDNGRPMNGDKLIYVDLCSGKDGLFRMRDKYPDAQVVTTFDSSYYGWGEGEGSQAFHAILDGIAARKDWEGIHADVRSVIGRSGHALPYNYLTPNKTLIRRRMLDRDHDGQADVLDRLVDFNTIKVAESTEREFQPVRSGHPADKLEGINVHVAALTINTLVGYNNTLGDIADKARVIGDGYFVPREGEENQIVKFIVDESGRYDVKGNYGDVQSGIRMQVNANFAHMSEEALRAVACYEFNKYMMEMNPPEKYFGNEWNWPEGWKNEDGAKLMGLIFAAANLRFDMGSRDTMIWNNLLEYAGLPDLPSRELFSFIDGIGMGDDRNHDYTGSVRVVRKFIEMLTPEQIAAIRGEG